MGRYYTIVKDDTLSAIAKREGLASWQVLYNAADPDGKKNKDCLRSNNPDLIYPDEVIWIPSIKKAGKMKKKSRSFSTGVSPVQIKFYADTDHTGNVDKSPKEWKNRQKKPGAILVFNCDRSGATSPGLDFQDDKIVNKAELKDFSKLVVKQNDKLPSGYDAHLILSSSDAKKVRIFDDFKDGAKVVIDAASTDYPMKDIRKRDYVFAIEAVTAVKKKGEETVKINLVVKEGKTEKFNDHVLFSIAPWLLLSNIEDVEKVYVAEVPSPHTRSNTGFISKLSTALGAKLDVIKSGSLLNRWVQDVIEIGFSSTPVTRTNPMRQFINSLTAGSAWGPPRVELFQQIKKKLIDGNFGHIRFSTSSDKSLDSFGNLEVTPPLTGHPFGRIFYGVRDTSYSDGHLGDEMGAEVVDFLNANTFQPPVAIPTNWLTVGHVDEFLSFVPNLKPGPKDKPYKLLQASPKIAISLCQNLKKLGLGGKEICKNKPGYEITVNDFLSNKDNLLDINNAINILLTKIRRKILRKEFDLPYLPSQDDIIGIPVIFNGTITDPSKTNPKVEDAIARTAGMVNCLVVKPKVIVPKPFGPKNASGKDVFEEYAREKLEALGLNFEPVNDWETYHELSGEIHCGTNTKRVPPKDWDWWKEK